MLLGKIRELNPEVPIHINSAAAYYPEYVQELGATGFI